MTAADDRPSAPSCDGLEVLHLDMDCFFAAVEACDDPRLAGKPLVVGGLGERGVVCSASYEARRYGVHSAMPTGEARRLCPEAVYLPPRHDRYADVSESIVAVLGDVTPLVERLGLDEAYLDVSGSHRIFGSSEVIAVQLRSRIALELGLPCSVGVARTKLIAKLASKAAKPRIVRLAPGRSSGIDGTSSPGNGRGGADGGHGDDERRGGNGRGDGDGGRGGDERRGSGERHGGDGGGSPRSAGSGVVVVTADDELHFLHRHSVRALPGVGPRTEQRLRRFGVSSVGDLAVVPQESLERLLGASHGGALHALANGVDERPVVAERATRSIGHEETFARDQRDPAELARRAREMAASVARRCRASGVEARTVTVKLRYADFSTHTRSRTLANATSSVSVLAEEAVDLLGGARIGAGVRLLGVHVSSLVEPGSTHEQLELFGGGGLDQARDLSALEAVAESVRARFGSDSIAQGSALSRRVVVRDDVGPTDAASHRSGRR